MIFNNKCEKVHLPSSKIEDKVGINQFFLFLNKAKTNNNVQLINTLLELQLKKCSVNW